jgi:hypothetical protein
LFLVFSFGSGEKGQLGRGRTGEHIVSAGKTGFDVEAEPGAYWAYVDVVSALNVVSQFWSKDSTERRSSR